MIEHRRSQRFQLRLSLQLLRAGGTTLAGEGETVNVSSGGILFTTDRRLEVGETVEFTMAFPPPPGATANTDLHCLGKVLRYEGSLADPERRAKLYVMAATIERYEFVRP